MTEPTVERNSGYTFHFVCCNRRYDYRTAWERNQAHKTHEKTFKHKLNQAVADEWVRVQTYFNSVIDKIMKGESYCGRHPNAH